MIRDILWLQNVFFLWGTLCDVLTLHIICQLFSGCDNALSHNAGPNWQHLIHPGASLASHRYEGEDVTSFIKIKHCQRHNGPEGWVLITSSNTNLDQISSSESWPSINQTSASRLNLKFKILSRISTKIQLHNLYKTSATKYRPNSSFKFCLNLNFKS